MPKIKLEAQVSKENLLEAVQQLSVTEIEYFMQNIIAFRAKKIVGNLSQKETELLLNINQGLGDDVQKSYEILIKKRKNEELTNNEYKELLNLTELAEKHQAQRLQYLVELASLRGISINSLMDDLDIKATDNE